MRRAVLLLLVPIGGCATKGDVVDLQSEMRAISARQDSAMAELRRSFDEADRTTMDSVRALSERMVNLQGNASGNQRDIQRQLDGVSELAGLNRRALDQLLDDVDTRWREIELRIAQAEVKDSTVEGGEVEVADPAEPPAITADEQALFEVAVANKERDLRTTALRGFNTFLETYPRSPLAPAAYVHRGELLTLEGRLEEAIEGYLEVPSMFPTADEIPTALYRAGVLCIDLQDYERAREYLERVINTYPDHHFAEQAREKLDEIP